MSKKLKLFLSILLVAIIVIIYILFQRSRFDKTCLSIGGKYSSEYNECYLLGSSDRKLSFFCASVLGQFNSCASPCRHSSKKNVVCPQVCELVCKF